LPADAEAPENVFQLLRLARRRVSLSREGEGGSMIQLTNADFETLCAAGAVRECLDSLEGEREAAIRKLWLRGLVGVALTAAAALALFKAGWVAAALIGTFVLLSITAAAAMAPLMAAKERLKHPVLEEAARKAGMEYLPDEFTPPAFEAACEFLFGGGGFSDETFTDLLDGKDAEGRGAAVYEACLQRRSGKNTHTIFSGQIYALERRPGRQGHIAILPDRGLLNFWKPASGMKRVRIEGDEEFENRFEVYATHEMEARQLLFDTAFRSRLLDLREAGRVFVYAGPQVAVVAAGGQDRFEPGNMMNSMIGEERVRLMFDDVCESLELLRQLKAKLG
jgi:Protein of unknown function (DUF3137)